MQATVVDKPPLCTEHLSDGQEKESVAWVMTPMKIKLNLCQDHFDLYLDSRLGANAYGRYVTRSREGRESREEATHVKK